MSTTAKLFVDKTGNSLFVSKDGKTLSKAVEVTTEVLDYNTGFATPEKLNFFIKATDEEIVDRNIKNTISAINSGALRAYRAFSHSPFWSGDTMDINPSTGVVLNRYSQVRLCPSAQFETLHRQYVTPVAVTTEEVSA